MAHLLNRTGRPTKRDHQAVFLTLLRPTALSEEDGQTQTLRHSFQHLATERWCNALRSGQQTDERQGAVNSSRSVQISSQRWISGSLSGVWILGTPKGDLHERPDVPTESQRHACIFSFFIILLIFHKIVLYQFREPT